MVTYIWKILEDPKSTTPTPVLFHICSETRKIALENYKLLLGSSREAGTHRIYINPTTDTLFIPDLLPYKWRLEPIFDTIHEDICAQLKQLAVDTVMLRHQFYQPGKLNPITAFQNLDSLTTVFSSISNRHHEYEDNLVLHKPDSFLSPLHKNRVTITPTEREWQDRFKAAYILLSSVEVKQRLISVRELVGVLPPEGRAKSAKKYQINAVEKNQYEEVLLKGVKATSGGDLSDLVSWVDWVEVEVTELEEQDKTWKKPECDLKYLYLGGLLAKYDF